MIADCLDRKSFATDEEAHKFRAWLVDHTGYWHASFRCDRCGRWHLTLRKHLEISKLKLKRERCITDLELHLQICRVAGIQLEELDRKVDLREVKVSGEAVQAVYGVFKRDIPPWE